MDAILKLVNKTVGQISLPFLCKAMTRTSLCFRSIVAILFCILNDLAFVIFNYRLILLTSVYHIAIKMNSACLLRSAGASYNML